MKRKRLPATKFAFLWRLMADPGLSASAKCVATALVLQFHNARTGQCNPSFGAIAVIVGRNRRNIFPAVNELKARGWLTFDGSKGGSSRNTNRFIFDFDAIAPVMPVSPVGVTPASSLPVTPTPPVMSTARGVTPAPHEPLRTTLPKKGEGVSASSSALAPVGAALEEKFEQLRAGWEKQKPDGVSKAKARKAFMLVCAEHDGDEVLASAHRWIAATPRRYLPRLENWLADGAWLNEPREATTRRPGAKTSLARLAIEYGGGE